MLALDAKRGSGQPFPFNTAERPFILGETMKKIKLSNCDEYSLPGCPAKPKQAEEKNDAA